MKATDFNHFKYDRTGENETMIEVRFHGPTGQGAVTSAELIALGMKKEVCPGFPVSGRREGARRSWLCPGERQDHPSVRIYEPDVAVVLDPSLLKILTLPRVKSAVC
jgi:Pyruvate/2-oxoacid:ferredoxin oxidoreductase gamma subunit